MRVAVVCLGAREGAGANPMPDHPAGTGRWLRVPPWLLWTAGRAVVVVTGDPESPGFPLPRLAAIARRHPVLVVSPSRMRSGIDTARACGVRGYVFADTPPARLGDAVREIAAGRGAWPPGWTPAATGPPVGSRGGPTMAGLVAVMIVLPVLLVQVHAVLGMVSAGSELAAAVVAGWVWRCRAAEDADLVGFAVVRARVAERAAFSRALHDRTLQTLEMLAAHADIDDGRLRHHLDDEARWLRGVVESGVDTGPRDLLEALGIVVGRHRRPTFEVTFENRVPHLPVLPPSVVTALAAGVAEALTNVAKHARVDRAEVTVSCDAGELIVEVTDRGCGLGAARPGRFGIRHSIHGRMAEVGGSAVVRAAGGPGTVVRLSYPALMAVS